MAKYSVPYTFVAGTRARAAQVNKNFDSLVSGLNEVYESKAEQRGSTAINFNVAEPVELTHAVTKRYVDEKVQGSGGGSGTGKVMFEVFHTLSTQTPPGAFSLRTGEIIPDAINTYISFWEALSSQGEGIIQDLTSVEELPEGYSTSFMNLDTVVGNVNKNRVFSPYSWVTSTVTPTSSAPIAVELEIPSLITCEYFKVNSHVFNTYNSIGDPDPGRAIKSGTISIRQADGRWVTAVIIDETDMPKTNERFFKSEQPKLEFNAIRLVVGESFNGGAVDVSVYPVNPESSSVRVVSEEQWQWEVATFGETGSFVLDEEASTIRLPKVTRFLSGITDLYQVGMPESSLISKSGGRWQDNENMNPTLQPDADTLSFDAVKTGLWIQVYNAVAEDALSNIRYIPHAILFEESYFRFVPEKETGWAVASGDWFDGAYYVDAMSELLNSYAQAIDIAGQDYKLGPNGMKFATNEVYQSTFTTYGECPYYVVDPVENKFKTPVSKNFIRLTNTIDNVGELQLDAAPNIKGTFSGVGQAFTSTAATLTGSFYRVNTANKPSEGVKVSNASNAEKDDYFGFDASRCSDSYGRLDENGTPVNEVRPKSSFYILCVFLGNEIPQSSSVDVFLQLKDHDSRIEQNLASIEELKAASGTDLEEIRNAISILTTATSDNTTNIQALNERIEYTEEDVETLQESLTSTNDRVAINETSISDLNFALNSAKDLINNNVDSIEETNKDLQAVSDRVTALETNKVEVSNQLSSLLEKDSSIEKSISDLENKDTEILASITSLQSKDAEVTTQLASLQSKDQEIEESISTATQSLTDAINLKASQTSLDSLTETVSDNTKAIQTNSQSIATLTESTSKVSTQLGGLSLVKITQEEYDALETKDENTLYFITAGNTNV